MLQIEGRNPLFKSGYIEIGKPINSTKRHEDFQWLDEQWLDKRPYPEQRVLFPQRTVVQFNSTYMELMGRYDRIKGSTTAWSLGFIGSSAICSFMFGRMLILLFERQTGLFLFIFLLFIVLFFGAILCFFILLFLKETFTYTYFPIRFNRKTGKVYVMHANKQAEELNWSELKFYTSRGIKLNNFYDMKGVILADDGITVTNIFSFPLTGTDKWCVLQHFEFIRRYMEAKNDAELTEVRNAIRYTHPVHKKRETPYVSFQRVLLSDYMEYINMEYSKNPFTFDLITILEIPVLWGLYMGRLLAINTSRTPRFSKEIEAECQISPYDRFDLDKCPPEGNMEAKPSLVYMIGFYIALFIFSMVMFLLMAGFVDVIGYAKGSDHESLSLGLIHIFSLQWLF